MKKPLIDLHELVRSRYLGKQAFLRRFVRYWGTTTVAGEEVLLDRIYYYNPASENARKVAKLLGFYGDLFSGSSKGIKNAWLYMNPFKGGLDLYSDIHTTYGMIPTVTEDVDEVINVQIGVFSHKVNMSGVFPAVRFVTSPLTDQVAVAQEIKDNYSQILLEYGVLSDDVYGDGYLSTLARYALLSTDLDVTITKVEMNLVEYHVDSTSTNQADMLSYGLNLRKIFRPTYTVSLKIKNPTFTSTTDILSRIATDFTAGKTVVGANLTAEQYNQHATYTELLRAMSLGSIPKADSIIPYRPAPIPTNPTYWVLSGGKYYLKTSVLFGKSIPLDVRVNMVAELLDSGYKEKSSSPLFTILAVIVVVVAAIYTGGAAATAGYNAVIVAATAVSSAALVLSVYAVLAQAAGAEEAALAASRLNSLISPFVYLASIIMIVNAAYSAVNTSVREAAATTLREAGRDVTEASIRETIATATTELYYEQAKTLAVDYMKDYDNLFKLFSKLTELHQKNQLAEIKADIKSKEQVLAEQEEANTTSKFSDMSLLFMKSYTNVLANDWSHYVYDTPYEPTSGTMHTGNSQATQVTAMRPASY